MTKNEENRLKKEITHIYESGASEIRIFEMIKNFLENRYSNKNRDPESVLILPEPMTMRDEFAIAWLNGFCSDNNQWMNLMQNRTKLGIEATKHVSKESYRMADAMMKARKEESNE